MIMERGARPDALPNPKRGKATLAALVLVGVGALAFGLGLGASYHLNAIESLGGRALADLAKPVMTERERFRLCSLSLTEAEANPIPTNEELEWIAEIDFEIIGNAFLALLQFGPDPVTNIVH
jgi:hypothetical protein